VVTISLNVVPTAKEILFSRTFSGLFQDKFPFSRTKLSFSRKNLPFSRTNYTRYMRKSISYLFNV